MTAGFESEARAATSTLADLLEPWGSRMRSLDPRWSSEISDDNTPIEFSVTLGDGREEVRALWEAQAEEPTVESHRQAALQLTKRLERDYAADLSRFRLLQDLFLPENMEGPFALWHSVVFGRNRKPSFKAYLNPAAQGPSRAPRLVEEALRRLGLERAWAALCQSAVTRGPFFDEVKYFALDLTAEAEARVKIYVRHHEATPSDLEATCRSANSYVPGEALEFARAMARGDEPLFNRAPFTCSSFVGGQDGRPAATTLYVPVCAYAPHDEAVRERVNAYLDDGSPTKAQYNAIVDGFATRPLDAGVGMQSWAALRRYGGKERYTLYLATEASRMFAPKEVPASTLSRTRFDSGGELVGTVVQYQLCDHPFLHGFKDDSDSFYAHWLALSNLRAALGDADTDVFSIEDHALLSHSLRSLERAIPASSDEAYHAAGQRLGRTLGAHLFASNLDERSAARVVFRIGIRQIVRAVARLLHEEATGDPTEQSLRGSEGEPRNDEFEGVHSDFDINSHDVTSTRKGAMAVHQSMWSMLDDLYVQTLHQLWNDGTSGTHQVHIVEDDGPMKTAMDGK